MKKIYLLLVVLMMSALHAKAQDIGACLLGTNAEGKKCWVCVNRGSAVEILEQTYYNVEINVLSCEDMFSKPSINLLGTYSMLIRQEAGKTFRYDEVKSCEEVLMDMTLEEGDAFVRPNGEQLMVERTETDAEGIKIIHLRGNDSDTEDTWRSDIGSVKSGILQVDDIEGITINCYQDNFTWVHDSGRNKYHYPEVNNDNLKQVSYCTEWIGSNAHTDIDFSFVDDSLHIKGIYCIGGGSSSMQIIQCIIDGNNIYIEITTDANYAPKYGIWGVDQYYYDLKIPGFKPGIYTLYNLYMPKGMQAICGDVDYRPFIEEGKVWKVGVIPVGEECAQELSYYYFDGDTIINAHKGKKLMNILQNTDGSWQPATYIAAVYEQMKNVYMCFSKEDNFVLFYVFDNQEEAEVFNCGLNNHLIHSSNKEYINTPVFKGNCIEFMSVVPENGELENVFSGVWLEGVGTVGGPIDNGLDVVIPGDRCVLMSCTVGDEVIYYNPDVIDGVNPPDDETKKRIDFTHIQKPRPKAPNQVAKASGEQVCGEYTMRLLDLGLGTLSENYHVTITDNTGKAVYDKTVRAADVLALNIDISEWTAPSYTITVENDDESYVGTFTPAPLTAVPSVATSKAGSSIYYDLQGRRLTTEPVHGLYIKDGRKYLKR